MKLEREQFRISTTIDPSTIDAGADTNPPQGWNRIGTSGCLLLVVVLFPLRILYLTQ